VSNEFSVIEFYEDGNYQYVCRNVGAEEAVRRAHVCTRKPAVLLGIIKQVMGTDGGDQCCFLWKLGEGVVFPPPKDQR
jgi:hypothetical protein